MRTIIAGSRTITDYAAVTHAIESAPWTPTTVLCGDARGVDALGDRWARTRGIAVDHYPAAWAEHGKMAGPRRNTVMAEAADALILVWDGKSKGSANMLAVAKRRGLRIHEVVL